MSWKEVRKNAKEPGGDGKADVDDAIDEGGEGQHLLYCNDRTLILHRTKCVKAKETNNQAILGYRYNIFGRAEDALCKPPEPPWGPF